MKSSTAMRSSVNWACVSGGAPAASPADIREPPGRRRTSRRAAGAPAIWACLTALLATTMAAAEGPDAHWIYVRSGDVEIYSDSDEPTTLDFAVKLQRMRAAMVKVTGIVRFPFAVDVREICP